MYKLYQRFIYSLSGHERGNEQLNWNNKRVPSRYIEQQKLLRKGRRHFFPLLTQKKKSTTRSMASTSQKNLSVSYRETVWPQLNRYLVGITRGALQLTTSYNLANTSTLLRIWCQQSSSLILEVCDVAGCPSSTDFNST